MKKSWLKEVDWFVQAEIAGWWKSWDKHPSSLIYSERDISSPPHPILVLFSSTSFPCLHYSFPWDTHANDYKLSGLRQHTLICLQFWRPEVGSQYLWLKSKCWQSHLPSRGSEGNNPLPCLFQHLLPHSLFSLVRGLLLHLHSQQHGISSLRFYFPLFLTHIFSSMVVRPCFLFLSTPGLLSLLLCLCWISLCLSLIRTLAIALRACLGQNNLPTQDP